VREIGISGISDIGSLISWNSICISADHVHNSRFPFFYSTNTESITQRKISTSHAVGVTSVHDNVSPVAKVGFFLIHMLNRGIVINILSMLGHLSFLRHQSSNLDLLNRVFAIEGSRYLFESRTFCLDEEEDHSNKLLCFSTLKNFSVGARSLT
jgi:hypothetical protein